MAGVAMPRWALAWVAATSLVPPLPPAAARELGKARSQLQRWMKKYAIDVRADIDLAASGTDAIDPSDSGGRSRPR